MAKRARKKSNTTPPAGLPTVGEFVAELVDRLGTDAPEAERHEWTLAEMDEMLESLDSPQTSPMNRMRSSSRKWRESGCRWMRTDYENTTHQRKDVIYGMVSMLLQSRPE